jgi:predicted NAD/FAD-binding protein
MNSLTKEAGSSGKKPAESRGNKVVVVGAGIAGLSAGIIRRAKRV